MRALLRVSGLVLLAACTSGCLTSTAVVRLKPDGSGTVEQTMLLNLKALEVMGQMLGKQFGVDPKTGQAESPKSFGDVISQADLEKMATRLGPGVRLVSTTPIKDGDREGARVVLAFDDINKIAVDPMSVTAAMGGGGGDATGTSFRLSTLPNGNAKLVIELPERAREGDAADEEEKAGEEAPDAGAEVPPEMTAMVKQMFAGMRFALDIEVVGQLVRTNSPWVSGSRVTVLEMDFDRLMQQEDVLKKLPTLGRDASMAETLALLKDIKGLKLSPPPIEIEFR